jgi:hypothetical protein
LQACVDDAAPAVARDVARETVALFVRREAVAALRSGCVGGVTLRAAATQLWDRRALSFVICSGVCTVWSAADRLAMLPRHACVAGLEFFQSATVRSSPCAANLAVPQALLEH